jgi:FAD:protein FMN transferase
MPVGDERAKGEGEEHQPDDAGVDKQVWCLAMLSSKDDTPGPPDLSHPFHGVLARAQDERVASHLIPDAREHDPSTSQVGGCNGEEQVGRGQQGCERQAPPDHGYVDILAPQILSAKVHDKAQTDHERCESGAAAGGCDEDSRQRKGQDHSPGRLDRCSRRNQRHDQLSSGVFLREESVESAAQTDGLVDPTLGHALVAVGYDRDISLVLAESTDPAGIPVPARAGAWRDIQRDPAGALLVPRGSALDLGATCKAWAADLIVAAIAAESDSTVVLSLGGDIAVAGPGGWPVAITETIDDPAGAEVVHLPYGGLATSSTAARRWIRDGVIRHHLIDPRTGEPTSGRWRTVTATGATCLAANTATTAAIVLGDRAVGWLTERDIPARLVNTSGRIVRTQLWPEPEAAS